MIHVYSAILIYTAVKYISLISFPCTLSFKFEIKRNINAATRNKRSAVLYLRILITFFMSFALIDPSTLTILLSTSQLYYEWSTMHVKILKLFQRIHLIKRDNNSRRGIDTSWIEATLVLDNTNILDSPLDK